MRAKSNASKVRTGQDDACVMTQEYLDLPICRARHSQSHRARGSVSRQPVYLPYLRLAYLRHLPPLLYAHHARQTRTEKEGREGKGREGMPDDADIMAEVLATKLCANAHIAAQLFACCSKVCVIVAASVCVIAHCGVWCK